MSEEEKKKSFGDHLLDVAGRTFDGLVDGAAERYPVPGRAFQAAFNTAGYQDKEMRRESAKEALLAQRMRNSEYAAGAEARAQERENQLTAAKEWASQGDVRAQEVKARSSKAALAEAQAKAGLESLPQAKATEAARMRFAQAQADNRYWDEKKAGLLRDMRAELSKNPMFTSMTYSEQEDWLKNEGAGVIDAKMREGDIHAIGNGDKEMFERYDRLFRGRGWKLIDGENGEKVLDMGNGVKVPATPETWEQAKGSINQKAAEALQVHANMSYAGTRGDPVKRAIASNVRALRPYNNGDMTGSYKAVQGWVSDSSEEEKTWFMFHQGLKDFRDSGVPMADKLEELGRCQQFLGKVGFTMEGLDLKNPNPESATFLELSTGRRMNFSEFEKFVESKDSLGTRIERRIAGEQWRSVSANGRRMMSSVQNGRKTKKEDAADVAESGATGAEARAILDGKAFVEKHGLEGSVSRIAEDCKSRKTAIKNEDDVYKAFDNARAEAEKVYLETDDYGKAREQFSQALEECGVSKELIPELWKDAELDDQIAKKTEQLKGMLRKDAAFAQGRAKYPKAARRKYSNKYEKGMLPREELAEEREALAKELNELEAQKRKRKEEREAALKQRAENKQKLMKFRGAK